MVETGFRFAAHDSSLDVNKNDCITLTLSAQPIKITKTFRELGYFRALSHPRHPADRQKDRPDTIAPVLEGDDSWLGSMSGAGLVIGDIISPVDSPEIWDVLAE